MKLYVKKSTTTLSVCLGLLGLLIVFALFVGYVASSSRTAVAQSEGAGGRLIVVYDRGEETAFITAKSTLREAFADQGITVDNKDAVEPSIDEELVASDYRVNIYRARPVTIIDGATRQRVVTPYQSAERIVKDAGITLYAEDTTKLAQSTDIIGDGAGLQLRIDRATVVQLTLYGEKREIRTQGETVAEMLVEKGIQLGEHGRASVPVSTPIEDGLQVRIWREGKQTITVDEIVSFSTEHIKDADRPVGYKSVQTKGVRGERTVTYEVEIRNGAEVSRTEIASIVTKKPVKQVEVIGTKPQYLPYTGGGTKTEWLAASSIPKESWGYADFMVSRESSWNPNAVNRSSGACGLAQALPCSKVPGNPHDPVNSLNWMNGYVMGRYGSWENAYNFWQRNHWY